MVSSIPLLLRLLFFGILASANLVEYQKRQGNDSSVQQCLQSADVPFSLPSNSSWSLDSEAWNARVAPVPSVVVFPQNEDQVSSAIKCAGESGVKVTTIGGNRSFQSMAFGRTDGALVVNLSNMKVLKYDDKAQTLTYGGPVTISEAAKFLWEKHSRALMHGRCPDVGMTGVAFGGGFGTLSRLHGTVLDDIVSVRVALADGKIVDASATENSELLWAVRGAAASFGVVLTVTIETFAKPSDTIVSYTIGFSEEVKNITMEENVGALTGLQAWAQSADNVDTISVRMDLKTNVSMKGFFYGSTSEFDTVTAGMLKHLPARMSLLEQQPYTDFLLSENFTTPGLIEGSNTERRYFYITSTVIPDSHPLTNETATSLFENTAYAPAPSAGRASGFVDLWGGAFTKTVAPDASAWKHDNNLLLVRWDLRALTLDKPFTKDDQANLRKGFYDFIKAYKDDGGVPQGFPNYRDADWTVEETAEYLFGSNWDRLVKAKKTLDPQGVFNADPQDVPVS